MDRFIQRLFSRYRRDLRDNLETLYDISTKFDIITLSTMDNGTFEFRVNRFSRIFKKVEKLMRGELDSVWFIQQDDRRFSLWLSLDERSDRTIDSKTVICLYDSGFTFDVNSNDDVSLAVQFTNKLIDKLLSLRALFYSTYGDDDGA